MKHSYPTLKEKARPAVACLAFSALIAFSLSGCNSGLTSSGDKIKLVITPVATPTLTPQTMPTIPPVTYTVRPGDTLWAIANLFGVGIDDIVRANNIADPSTLSEGQVLTIPGRSAVTSTPSGGTSKGTPGVTAPQTAATGPTQSPTPNTTQTALAASSPTMPPPEATPPQGPSITEPTQASSSSPVPTISPTSSP